MTEEDLLLEREDYLANGVHIGTRSQHKDMEEYIFHVKKNRLAVLNVEKTDQQIRKVAKEIADYTPSEVLAVGRKNESYTPLQKLSESTGIEIMLGRFMPGTLTNPENENFTEPELLIATDPEEDYQAIKEAKEANIPVVAIADSETKLENINHPIPGNNKGESAIGAIYYLLAQQIAEAREEEFNYELEDFGAKTAEEETEEEPEETEE